MEITQEILDRLNGNPLYNSIGIRVLKAADGRACSRLEPNQDFCWPFPGQPHGGVLFTFMDTTMAWAVVGQLEPGYNCMTINMDIHYTALAKDGPFICTARTAFRTGRMSFVRAEIQDAKEKTLALGQGTFRIIRSDFIV